MPIRSSSRSATRPIDLNRWPSSTDLTSGQRKIQSAFNAKNLPAKVVVTSSGGGEGFLRVDCPPEAESRVREELAKLPAFESVRTLSWMSMAYQPSGYLTDKGVEVRIRTYGVTAAEFGKR
jgi:hypothetical protein